MFKVGDRVVCVDASAINFDLRLGGEYIVSEVFMDSVGEQWFGLDGVDDGKVRWYASRFSPATAPAMSDGCSLLDKMIALWAEEVTDADLETLAHIERALNALQRAVHDRRRIVQQTRVLSYGDEPLDLNDLDCD